MTRRGFLLSAAAFAQSRTPPPQISIQAPYVETPLATVAAMLRLARVRKDDLLYDLGCGDGRIVIEAARRYGARGLGIDINADRVAQARAKARKAGVDHLASFEQGDLFALDLRPATVVTLYLMQAVNLELRPKLRAELRAGARVVSHNFHMGDWRPARELEIGGERLYLWVI